ncbi:PEP-CTERM sorting domain-containing protein [Gemmatimonas sp.]
MLAAAFAVTTPVAAQTSTFVAGTTYSSDPLNTYTTFGQYMLGMNMTWTFDDGSFDSAVFAPFIGPSNDLMAGVKKNGLMFGLEWNDDTFMDSWFADNKTGKTISSIRLNGQPGKVVFDCGWTSNGCAAVGDPEMLIGSTNSARGRSFQVGFTIGTSMAITGEYANLVGLGGAEPVGDIFEQFTMRFTNGFVNNGYVGFLLDTDNTSGVITRRVPPPVSTVPEPTSSALMLLGFSVLWGARHRRVRVS